MFEFVILLALDVLKIVAKIFVSLIHVRFLLQKMAFNDIRKAMKSQFEFTVFLTDCRILV